LPDNNVPKLELGNEEKESASMKIRQTDNDLRNHLMDQIQFLLRSISLYDSGLINEAKRMAVIIRLLAHDTHKSVSLLSQLDMKNILFYDTSYNYDPTNLAPTLGLIFTRASVNPTFVKFLPALDSREEYKNRKIPFEEWWNKIVLADKVNNKFRRIDLILSVANKDGGVHVDPQLDKSYGELTRRKTLGLKFVINDLVKEHGIEPIFASIRQISHEIMKSLKDELPEIVQLN
jgi:hypothetical protein